MKGRHVGAGRPRAVKASHEQGLIALKLSSTREKSSKT